MENFQTNVVKPKTSFTVNEAEYLLIDSNFETELDNSIKNVNDYINNNHGKGKSNAEQDSLYLESQKLWKEFAKNLKDAKYNFYLNQDQLNFLTDLVLTKLEYDVNTVFFAIELKSMFDEMKSTKLKNSTDMACHKLNATEITYLYHLISKHNVKGLNKSAIIFSEILLKIGDISKVFNYYDTTGKNLSVDIQDWVATFEENVVKEKRKSETIEAQVLPNN
jgi:hypothetical protein